MNELHVVEPPTIATPPDVGEVQVPVHMVDRHTCVQTIGILFQSRLVLLNVKSFVYIVLGFFLIL